MRIDLAVLEPGQVISSHFAETIDSLTDDVDLDAPVVGDVEVARDSRTVRLLGRVETTAPLVCGRCAINFRQPLRVHVSEEFVVDPPPGQAATSAGHREVQPDDFVVPIGPDLALDVTELIRQQLLLALPMVPLHRPDCRGLCPRCGANWNETTCSHQVPETDPRLAPLLELKDRLPE